MRISAALFLFQAALGCRKEVSTGAVLEPPESDIVLPDRDTGDALEPHPHAVNVRWSLLAETPAGEFSMVSASMHDPNRIFVGTDKSGLFFSMLNTPYFVRIGKWEGPSPHVMAPVTELPNDPMTIISTSTYALWMSHDIGRFFLPVERFAEVGSGIVGIDVLGDRIVVAEANGEIWSTENQFASIEHVGVAVAIPATKEWRTEDPAVKIRLFDPNHWLLSQRRGQVLQTSNGGASWQSVLESPFDYDSLTVQNQSAIIASPDGVLLSTDWGQTWNLLVDSPIDCRSLSWRGNKMAAACADGLFLSENNGQDWTLSALTDSPWSVDISPLDTERIFVGAKDAFYASYDGGESFSSHEAGLTNSDIAHLATDPSDPDRLLLGTQCMRGLFQSTDRGASWTKLIDNGHYMMAIVFAPSDPEWVYAADTQFIFRSTDGGRTFDEMPFNVDGAVHPHGMSVHPEEPLHVLIGTSDKAENQVPHTPQLLRSVDGGEHWERVGNGLPDGSISFIDVQHDPTQPDRVLVAAGPGGMFHDEENGAGQGLWLSKNGAESFSIVPEIGAGVWVYAVAYSTILPGHVFTTTSAGIFRSVDHGDTWSRVEEDEIFQSVVWHPTHEKVAFVSSGLSAKVTLDAGETWNTFSDHSDHEQNEPAPRPPPPPDGGGNASNSALAISADGTSLFLGAGLSGGQRGDLSWDMVHPEGTPEDR